MNTRVINTRLLFVVILLLPLFTAGCKTSMTPTEEAPPQVVEEEVATSTSEETISISMYWWGEEGLGQEEWVNQTLARYMESHPNIEIDVVFQGVDEVIPNFVAAAEANEGPDMATLWYGMYMNEDIWSGHIAPISDYTSDEEMDHWLTRKLNTFDGKVWAIDMYSQAHVMSYNKNLFADAGLDPDNPPATWTEFMEACNALKEAGIVPLGFGIADGWQGTQFANMILPQTLENYISEVAAAVVGEGNWTQRNLAEFWYKMAELRDAGCINEDAASLTYYEGQELLLTGKAAMTIHASDAALAAVRDLGEDTIGIMPTVSLDNEPENWAPFITEAWVIPSWSPHKEIAADILNFFHSSQSMQEGYTITKGAVLPGDDRFDASIIENPVVKKIWDLQLEGSRKKAYMIDALLPWAILDEGQIRAFGLMFSENMAPEDAAQMMEDASQRWRDANPEVLEKYKQWANSLSQ